MVCSRNNFKVRPDYLLRARRCAVCQKVRSLTQHFRKKRFSCFWGQITHSLKTAIWPMLACHFRDGVDLQKKVPLGVFPKPTRRSYVRVYPTPNPPQAGQKNRRPGLCHSRKLLWLVNAQPNKQPNKPTQIGAAHARHRHAAWLARRGERTLRVPPCCSLPVSHSGGPRTSRRPSLVVVRACTVRACVLAWRGVPRKRKRKEYRPKKDKSPRQEKCCVRAAGLGSAIAAAFLCVRSEPSDASPVQGARGTPILCPM